MVIVKRLYGEKCNTCRGDGYRLERPALTVVVCLGCDGHGVAGVTPVYGRWVFFKKTLDGLVR